MKLPTEHISDRDLLETIYKEMVSMKKLIEFIPQWIPIYVVSNNLEMSYRNMYKRVVESGVYQSNIDYKKVDNEICVNKNIIHTLQRKRKPKTKKGVIK